MKKFIAFFNVMWWILTLAVSSCKIENTISCIFRVYHIDHIKSK